MSGGTKAQPLGRPLDGGVRAHSCLYANVVVVELTLLYLDEPMPRIEAVGLTAAQRTNAHLHSRCIGLGKDLRKHGRTNAFALVTRMDVQVIEKQARAMRLENEEADAFTVELDMASVLRGEAGKE